VQIDIMAIGKLKNGPEAELYTRYAERISALARGLGLSGPKLMEFPESPARRDDERKKDEARALTGAIAHGAFVLALDERGAALSSTAFAERIGRLRDDGCKSFACLIGGADGLSTDIRAQAALTLSFGAMTMPHQLVRVLLAEQIYRACTILSGHPYHRV
jgi:23S rRNA (pseudouridine1915-N3)-methyltransferase